MKLSMKYELKVKSMWLKEWENNNIFQLLQTVFHAMLTPLYNLWIFYITKNADISAAKGNESSLCLPLRKLGFDRK